MRRGIIFCLAALLFASCGGDKIKKALDLKYEGIKLVQISNFDKAIEILDQSLDYNDKDPETYYYLGNAWFGKKDVNKAIHFYSKAIEVDASYALAYVNRGKMYSMKNDKDNACKDWLKAESLGISNLKEDTKFCH